MSDATTETVTDFAPFAKAVAARFAEMSGGELYVAALDDKLFDTYLGAFPAGTDPVYRKRSVHDCQTCKQFVRRLGKVVAIKDGEVRTVWGGLDLPHPYKAVADALDRAVKAAPVASVFRTKELRFGTDHNYDAKTNERHDHFCGVVAARHRTDDADTQRGKADAIFRVAKRGLNQIREADLLAVLDLIGSNGLYRGAEFRPQAEGFLTLLREFRAAGGTDLFVWEHLWDRNAAFRNTVIGTLLVDLAEGKEFDEAVKAFETKVAPMNYKRPTAAITPKMVDAAVNTLADLGLEGAVHRRYARMSDVNVNDVLFVDNDTRGKMKGGVAELLEGAVTKPTPSAAKATPIAAEDFLRDVLPGAKSLDVLVENRHAGNFVSLTGGDGPERLFKWDNNFAWSYDGDVTDSVKQRVKAAGGNVNALLRVSLSWFNFDDLDVHCVTPSGTHVFYNHRCGVLDVDMNAGIGRSRTPVENLSFTSLEDGVYRVFVNQFQRRETSDGGFAIEVEFGGVLHQYSHPKFLAQGENVECFRLFVKKGKLERVETALTGGTTSQEKWGVKTETLVPVAAAMYSPNHWGENAVGAKHLIFALKGCKNPGATRGVYNEFLDGRLSAHRKVFEILGAKTKCPYSEEQVSGVGFTAARGDSVAVVVDGKRSYLLKF